jgi:hypothetical protein
MENIWNMFKQFEFQYLQLKEKHVVVTVPTLRYVLEPVINTETSDFFPKITLNDEEIRILNFVTRLKENSASTFPFRNYLFEKTPCIKFLEDQMLFMSFRKKNVMDKRSLPAYLKEILDACDAIVCTHMLDNLQKCIPDFKKCEYLEKQTYIKHWWTDLHAYFEDTLSLLINFLPEENRSIKMYQNSMALMYYVR